ncbi:MAG: hypothetical protein LC640_01740 [Frankia sp.]|nr:hypothetical protein [Frankia sp.]
MRLRPLPAEFASTRDTLHRVAAHVLGRRRHQLTGKFGLRATPGGIGTPAAGPEHETVRITGTNLLHERTGAVASTATLDLSGATLREAAAFVEVDVDAPFSVGRNTPDRRDPDAALAVDPEAAAVLWHWFAFAWRVLDAAVTSLGAEAAPTVVQLWPEHFDAGCDAASAGGRVNLGASPGDGFSASPYLYVGPWGPERPGDGAFWNAPFGAALSYDVLLAAADPVATAASFLRRGWDLMDAAAGVGSPPCG